MAGSRSFVSFSICNVDGPARPLATGAIFPASADVLFVEASSDLVVALTLRTVDQRPVVTRVEVRPVHPAVIREVTAEDVHTLPLGQLTEQAIRAVAASFADERSGPGMGDAGRQAEDAINSRRRRAMTDDLLNEVAEVVRADPYGEPRRAVARHFPTSLRTASRWIATAKERGFINATNKETDR